jgi:truncated hemoglobin YjbI
LPLFTVPSVVAFALFVVLLPVHKRRKREEENIIEVVATMSLEKMPRFRVKFGSMTRSVQEAYIALEIECGRMPADSLRIEKIVSLEASDDPDDPLYFWQLYSILGKRPVRKIVQNFYTRVFRDQDDDDFRATFEKSSEIEYHVLLQTFMYLDCFGGGRYYAGEQARIDMHHNTAARNIMTQQGADKWTRYMRASLDDETEALDQIDPRVRPALNSFLKYFMNKYAGIFGFDSSDLHFGDATIPALPLRDWPEDSLKAPTVAEAFTRSRDI